jgi:glutaredoxin-related protein
LNGELVGGSDIMKDKYQIGEMQKLLQGDAQRA